MLTTTEVAEVAAVAPSTIKRWANRLHVTSLAAFHDFLAEEGHRP